MIANFRAGEMVRREKSKKVGITHVSIVFQPEFEYCETAQKYRKKYDGKIVRIKGCANISIDYLL